MSDSSARTHPGDIYPGAAVHRLPGRVEMPGYEGRVYVVEFSSGLVKVGRSQNVRRRVSQHRGTAEAMDLSLARVWVSPPHENHTETERELIAFGIARATRRIRDEYFVGCTFERFMDCVRRLEYRPLDREAARTHAEAKSLDLKRVWAVPPAPAGVWVSPEYFHASEEWMSLTRGISPSGKEREDVELVDWSRSSDHYALVESLAEALEIPVFEVRGMNYVDLISRILEMKVRIAVAGLRIYAYNFDRFDMMEPIGVLSADS